MLTIDLADFVSSLSPFRPPNMFPLRLCCIVTMGFERPFNTSTSLNVKNILPSKQWYSNECVSLINTNFFSFFLKQRMTSS